MKWSWKTFGVQLVSIFVLALGLAYGISMLIDAKRGQGAPDSTLISMALGGLVAPLILSTIAGWKGWSLKSSLAVSFIVAAIYASNPAFGIICVMVSTALYFVAFKCRQVLAYYAPPKSTPEPAMSSTLSQILPLPPFDEMNLEDLGEEDGSGQTTTVHWEGHGTIRVHVVIPDPASPVVRANYEEIRRRWPEFIDKAIGEVANLIREYEHEAYAPDPAVDHFAFPVPTEPLSDSPGWTFYINSEPAWVVDFEGFEIVGGQGVF